MQTSLEVVIEVRGGKGLFHLEMGQGKEFFVLDLGGVSFLLSLEKLVDIPLNYGKIKTFFTFKIGIKRFFGLFKIPTTCSIFS